MADRSIWFKPHIATTSGLVVFLLVLAFSDWLVYAASFALFRLDPRAVPENFSLVVRTSQEYRPLWWPDYPRAGADLGVRSFRLPEASGTLPGKATFWFTVLEDDGARQLVEVRFAGPYKSVSRYEAYADRVVPLAYRGMVWSRDGDWDWLVFFVAVVAAGLTAWGVRASVRRRIRLQQT